jgi:hypothetical protein
MHLAMVISFRRDRRFVVFDSWQKYWEGTCKLTYGSLSTVAVAKPEAQGEGKKWAKSLPLPFIARPLLAHCSFIDAFALPPGSQRGVTVSQQSEQG